MLQRWAGVPAGQPARGRRGTCRRNGLTTLAEGPARAAPTRCRAGPRQLRKDGQLRSQIPRSHRPVLCRWTRRYAAATMLLERKRLRCTLLACRSQTSELVMAARMRRHVARLEVAPELPEVRLQLVARRHTLLPARPMAYFQHRSAELPR